MDETKVIITFQADKEMLEKLKKIAKINRASVSWVVRNFVEDGIENYQSPQATIGDLVKGRGTDLGAFTKEEEPLVRPREAHKEAPRE